MDHSTHIEALFAHAPVAFSFLDRELRYVRVNERFASWSGIPPEQAVGRSVHEVWPELGREIGPQLRGVLATGEPCVDQEVGHWLMSHYAVPDADGSVAGVASIVVDVTRLKEAESRLEELLTLEQAARLEIELAREDLAQQATTDALTGLANRLAVSEHLTLALSRSRRTRLSVAVLYLDLDGFKTVNDSRGHAAGDEVLRVLGRRLRSIARETDVVARVGGDEFLILLADLKPGSEAADVARAVAARILSEIGGPIPLADGEAIVSGSIGISLYPYDAPDAETLLANADAAMYESKRSGAGRALFFGDAAADVA